MFSGLRNQKKTIALELTFCWDFCWSYRVHAVSSLQISYGCAGHTGFSAILLSLPFLLLPYACLSEVFQSHLWVLCAVGTLGCCSNAPVVYWLKVFSVLWAVFHWGIIMNSLPFPPPYPVQEQSGTTAPLITPITLLLGISLLPEIKTVCLICLSLFPFSALHSPSTTCTQAPLSIYSVTWAGILPLLPDFSASTVFCDHS